MIPVIPQEEGTSGSTMVPQEERTSGSTMVPQEEGTSGSTMETHRKLQDVRKSSVCSSVQCISVVCYNLCRYPYPPKVKTLKPPWKPRKAHRRVVVQGVKGEWL